MKIKTTEILMIDGSIGIVKDTDKYKLFKSHDYNFFFNKKDGLFVRWGTRKGEEKVKKVTGVSLMIYKIWCEFFGKIPLEEFLMDLERDGSLEKGIPEILDYEVSTKCGGISINGNNPYPCKFCYKSNNNRGTYISTEDFTKVIDKMPSTLCQCAMGIGNVDQPNLFELMDVCIDRDIVPNITINGDRMTDEIYDNLASRVGAISVSYYDKNLTFNAIHELATKRGLKQINIHYFLSEESFNQGMQLIDDVENDSRTKDINAIVFLSAKLRGNAKINDYHILSQKKFNIISQKALHSSISVGMDSCSAFKTLISYDNEPNFKMIEQCVESCESSIYSAYISKDCFYFPCSFSQGIKNAPGNWTKGINVLECNDFLTDIWFNQKTRTFSNEVIKCRECKKSCAIFEI